MDLRLLRYFETVAREGSVTRAAQALGIQQAPLSQQIMVLEAELGVQLFQRLPRGMTLTEAGRALLQRSQSILADVEAAAHATRRAALGQTGALRIGLTTSASLHPLPARLIRAFRRARPEVAVDLRQDSTAGLLRRIAHNMLDVAFVRTVSAPPNGLRVSPLDHEEMRVALPQDHRLAERKSAIPLSALANEAFIGYPHGPGAGMYDTVVRACRLAGFEPRVEFSAPQIFGTLSLVAAGLGVTIVPQCMQAVTLNGLCFRRQSDRKLTAALNLVMGSEPPTGAKAAFDHLATKAKSDS